MPLWFSGYHYFTTAFNKNQFLIIFYKMRLAACQRFLIIRTSDTSPVSPKGALSGAKQISATESLLKMIKNAIYFISKALFVLKVFKFLSWLFGHVLKRLDSKDKVNFKFYDVTAWLTNICNTHIAQYLQK